MNVSNCRICGRLFNVISNENVCPSCKQEQEEKFQRVRDYLDEHRNASVEEVARENEVSVKLIKQWLREERLTFTSAENSGLNCENCGKPICSGKLCNDCRKNMVKTLDGLLNGPKEENHFKSRRDGNRMRFLHND